MVNGLMENRHWLLLGINVESFRGPAPERTAGAVGRGEVLARVPPVSPSGLLQVRDEA